MSGGPKYEYRWQDNDKYKKPTVLSASDYIAELMQWVEQLINDEAVFPTKVGACFCIFVEIDIHYSHTYPSYADKLRAKTSLVENIIVHESPNFFMKG